MSGWVGNVTRTLTSGNLNSGEILVNRPINRSHAWNVSIWGWAEHHICLESGGQFTETNYPIPTYRLNAITQPSNTSLRRWWNVGLSKLWWYWAESLKKEYYPGFLDLWIWTWHWEPSWKPPSTVWHHILCNNFVYPILWNLSLGRRSVVLENSAQ